MWVKGKETFRGQRHALTTVPTSDHLPTATYYDCLKALKDTSKTFVSCLVADA